MFFIQVFFIIVLAFTNIYLYNWSLVSFTPIHHSAQNNNWKLSDGQIGENIQKMIFIKNNCYVYFNYIHKF